MKNFLEQFEPIQLDIKGVRLPKVEIPQKYIENYKLSEGFTTRDFLALLCKDGLVSKGLKSKEYIDRLDYELKTITELGFTDYILLVWDVVNFCNENDIPIGKGRGSAAGSLVNYLIGITGIDPIKYGLLFERFISKTRARSKIIDGVQYIDGSLAPDVDLDVCTDGRARVVLYLEKKYENRFCKLPTISKLASKQVIKDVGKILKEIPDDEMTVVTKSIPTQYGRPSDIVDAIEESEKFKDFAEREPDVILVARKLEGLMRQKGSHASAYLISYEKLDDFLPCERDKEGNLTSSLDMHYAQEECIKLDVLGLHGVTLVKNVLDLCEERGINLDNFDPNDKFIYDRLQTDVAPYGLFQIGADANFEVLKKVKPKDIEGLSAVLALARPGALDYVDEYVENRHNDHFGIKELKEILDATHNVPLYQEQTMAIAHKVFGFTLEDAETLRRVIGKKKVDEMPIWEERVFKAAKDKGLSEDVAKFYWKLLDDSANYSFNKCLSPDTIVETNEGDRCLFEIEKCDSVLAFDTKTKQDHFVEVLNIYENEVELYEVEFEDGRKIKCSMNHKFLCEDGRMRTLEKIILNGLEIACKE